jgi:hypothetical protein
VRKADQQPHSTLGNGPAMRRHAVLQFEGDAIVFHPPFPAEGREQREAGSGRRGQRAEGGRFRSQRAESRRRQVQVAEGREQREAGSGRRGSGRHRIAELNLLQLHNCKGTRE